MKKNKKVAPKKAVAVTKTAKKAAPAKKPAGKPAAKPASKTKAPEKKAAPAKAPEKTKAAPAVVKKSAAPAPAAKDAAKKPAPAAPLSAKSGAKNVEDKVVRGTGNVLKKEPAAAGRPGAMAGAAVAAKNAAQAIKVEPKIIETPQEQFVQRAPDETLFSSDELDHFKDLLESERSKILAKARRAMEEGNIAIDKDDMFDEVDQASAMIEQNLTFRLLDRDRKLLSEIDHALAKLDTGDYGYCEGTGEPIPKRRLELRPWCRHSVKYKEKLERMKKSGRGVVDEDEV